jgi:hypothetical protein
MCSWKTWRFLIQKSAVLESQRATVGSWTRVREVNSLDLLFGMCVNDGSMDAWSGARRVVEILFWADGRDRDRSASRENCTRGLYTAVLGMERYLLICLWERSECGALASS